MSNPKEYPFSNFATRTPEEWKELTSNIEREELINRIDEDTRLHLLSIGYEPVKWQINNHSALT